MAAAEFIRAAMAAEYANLFILIKYYKKSSYINVTE
jgi:hypothetical protein